MNVNSEFSPAINVTDTVAPSPDRLAPPPNNADVGAVIAIAFNGFADAMQGRAAKLALTATKVLLFNFFLFAPIVALFYLVFRA